VSQGKAIKFGKQFIALIAQYVEENDIEKPDDFIMKNVANKSALKVFIIQNIDKQIPLENIARSKDISLAELMTAMETIVASGTKLNVNYCLDEELDEDEQDEIFDFFREAEEDDLDVVYEEFKDTDVSIEQLQLLRIKFLSEYGN
jgi:ATP-dependent DNA helicase RecQ